MWFDPKIVCFPSAVHSFLGQSSFFRQRFLVDRTMPNLRFNSDRRAGLDLSDKAPFVAQTFEASENKLKLLGRHHVYVIFFGH